MANRFTRAAGSFTQAVKQKTGEAYEGAMVRVGTVANNVVDRTNEFVADTRENMSKAYDKTTNVVVRPVVGMLSNRAVRRGVTQKIDDTVFSEAGKVIGVDNEYIAGAVVSSLGAGLAQATGKAPSAAQKYALSHLSADATSGIITTEAYADKAQLEKRVYERIRKTLLSQAGGMNSGESFIVDADIITKVAKGVSEEVGKNFGKIPKSITNEARRRAGFKLIRTADAAAPAAQQLADAAPQQGADMLGTLAAPQFAALPQGKDGMGV